jgi:septal ring factor EnvC (AmiA/AmiB activator)
VTDSSLSDAIDRLTRAVDRIEKAVAARQAGNPTTTQALAALEQRHERLRARVQETIGRLDTMIGAAD